MALMPTWYSHFSSLFAIYDFCNHGIRYQWKQEFYISMFKTSSVLFISNGTAKTKLAILPFLYCGEFVKTSIDLQSSSAKRILVKNMCNFIAFKNRFTFVHKEYSSWLFKENGRCKIHKNLQDKRIYRECIRIAHLHSDSIIMRKCMSLWNLLGFKIKMFLKIDWNVHE